MPSVRLVGLLVVVACVFLAGCSTGPGEQQPDATAVKNDTVGAMDAVETYAVSAHEERTVTVEIERKATIEQTKVVNRSARKLRTQQRTEFGGRSTTVDLYLVDGTLYQRSDAFVRTFDSEWIAVNASQNISRVWDVHDTLARHKQVLAVSEVRLNGTLTRNGTEYYVLVAEPRPAELEAILADLLGGPNTRLTADDLEIVDAQYTFWVDTETNRPAFVMGRMNSTYAFRGQTVRLNQSFEFTYERYGSTVTVTLPEGANDATEIGGEYPLVRTGNEEAAIPGYA